MSYPGSLPPLGEMFAQDDAARKAYERLLPLENQLELPIRILGHMLIQAPSLEGRTYVAKSINDTTTDQMLFDLGQTHLDHLIGYFTSTAQAIRASSTDYSESFAESITQEIPGSCTPMSHAEAKEQAFIRDNYRCMLSGTIDINSVSTIPGLLDEVTNQPELPVSYTECCHILPRYVSHNLEGEYLPQGSSKFCTIATLFGGILDHELSGPGIHNLRNIMTLEMDVRHCFNNLKLWLEPIKGAENKYKIQRSKFYICADLPATITFSSSSPDLPLPDPQYLALHAACASVVHATGAAEYIARLLRDAERQRSLMEDGSSGELSYQPVSKDSFVEA